MGSILLPLYTPRGRNEVVQSQENEVVMSCAGQNVPNQLRGKIRSKMSRPKCNANEESAGSFFSNTSLAPSSYKGGQEAEIPPTCERTLHHGAFSMKVESNTLFGKSTNDSENEPQLTILNLSIQSTQHIQEHFGLHYRCLVLGGVRKIAKHD